MYRMYSIVAILLFPPGLAAESTTKSTTTEVTVRAISRDAKVIGDGVGGARISIRDAESGELLASGIQTGGTGNTRRIMNEPRTRGSVVYGTEDAALFVAQLELAKPTQVEISAEGPLKYPQAMQRVSKTMLLIPGRHIRGEGVLLEIPGFIIDLSGTPSAVSGNILTVNAKVIMTCGCPTEPGGLWDADQISVTARISSRGVVVSETPMKYAGQPSSYSATLPKPAEGVYELEVLASDTHAGNFGRASSSVTVQSAAGAPSPTAEHVD